MVKPQRGANFETSAPTAAPEEKDVEEKARRVLEAAFPGEEARYFLLFECFSGT
jgi:hypothetical protein